MTTKRKKKHTTEGQRRSRRTEPHAIETVNLPPSVGIAVREVVALTDLPSFFARAFHDIDDAIVRAGGACAGAPFAQYHSAPPAPIDVEAVFPIHAHIVLDDEARAKGVKAIELPGGAAVEVLHVGSYDSIGPVYESIFRYLAEHELVPAGPPREVYLTDPADADVSQQKTVIVQPTKPSPARASHEAPLSARARP